MWYNEPDGLVSLANERLYCAWSLRSARAALCPGGVLAVWSAYPDTSFSLRLSEAGYDVSEAELDIASGDSSHRIWLASS